MMKRICMRAAIALVTLCLLLGVTVVLPTMAEESPRLSIDKTEYEEGESILVTAYGEGYDWIALYAATDTVQANSGYAAAYWYYVAQEGHLSGETIDIQFADHIDMAARPELYGIPAGDYQIVLHSNNSYDIVERIFFTVKAAETELATEPETLPETEPVTDPETLPETAPETAPETVPETAPETVPETAPDTALPDTSELETQPDLSVTDAATLPAESETVASVDTSAPADTEPAAEGGCASVMGVGSAAILLAAAWVVAKKK